MTETVLLKAMAVCNEGAQAVENELAVRITLALGSDGQIAKIRSQSDQGKEFP